MNLLQLWHLTVVYPMASTAHLDSMSQGSLALAQTQAKPAAEYSNAVARAAQTTTTSANPRRKNTYRLHHQVVAASMRMINALIEKEI
ncbi:hypothetical protein [Pseudomonas cavernae]|uniref:hypothetical protein n=1 Tax=Pseudomonas cavernae TaxID=2320867 RepID=UPI0013C4A24F|nr:hypothetical protein [Pseudomonas cavernae]